MMMMMSQFDLRGVEFHVNNTINVHPLSPLITVILYLQNGDGIATKDRMLLLHPIYRPTAL